MQKIFQPKPPQLQRKTLNSAAFIAMWRCDMRDVIKYMRKKKFLTPFPRFLSLGEAEMGKVKWKIKRRVNFSPQGSWLNYVHQKLALRFAEWSIFFSFSCYAFVWTALHSFWRLLCNKDVGHFVEVVEWRLNSVRKVTGGIWNWVFLGDSTEDVLRGRIWGNF